MCLNLNDYQFKLDHGNHKSKIYKRYTNQEERNSSILQKKIKPQ